MALVASDTKLNLRIILKLAGGTINTQTASGENVNDISIYDETNDAD